jgi:hypothetical protein
VAIRAAEKGTDNDRIVVSDDESSGSNSSGSINFYDGSEDDASEDWTDKGTDDEDADAADITDADGKADRTIKSEVNVRDTSVMSKRVEELSDDEGSDNDESDDGGDDESDDESDDDSVGESDDGSSAEGDKIALTGGDVAIESDDINGHTVGDNVDLVAFLMPQTDDKSIDIGIMPISSNQKGLLPYEDGKPLPDSFKQMKVEELRKLIVSKLGMTDDEAKKLKKPQLIQRLSESHG